MLAAFCFGHSLVRVFTKKHASMNRAAHFIPNTPDVLVRNEGTLFLFCPLTTRGKSWIDENVQPDALWFGGALVVEHRFAWALAQGMFDEGLVLA